MRNPEALAVHVTIRPEALMWLKAQIDDDEADAKAVTHIAPLPHWGVGVAGAEHIARHNPARVLREVKVKRATIHRFEVAELAVAELAATKSSKPSEVHAGLIVWRQGCRVAVLNLLYLYSDQSGFRIEWMEAR